MRTGRIITITAAMLSALAACGGGSSGSATTAAASTAATTAAPTTAPPTTVATTAAPTTTLPPTTTTPPTTEPPTTTTTVDPMAVAPLQYTALAYENNTALAAINAKYANTLSERNLRATCAETAPVVEAFANGVASTAWPEPVQDEAAALAKDAAAGAGDLYDCANARTAADAIPAWNRYADRGGDAASAMRLALGLPIERTT